MNRRLLTAAMFLFSLHAGQTPAAEEAAPAPVRIGLGVSFSPGDVLRNLFILEIQEDSPQAPVSLATLHIPLLLQSRLRLEPELGLLTSSYGNPPDYSRSYRLTRLGTSVTYAFTPAEDTVVYAGGRLGMLGFSEEHESDEYSSNYSRTDLYIGLTAGGEHFVGKRFSVGFEGQLNYVNQGEPKSSSGNSSGSEDANVAGTHMVLFARFYFL